MTKRNAQPARLGSTRSTARSARWRRHLSVSVVPALAATLGACRDAEENSATSAAEKPVELKMPIVSENVAFLPANVAISEGIYEKNGVHVSLTNSQSGAAVVQTVLGGGAPLGAAGADTILNATSAGAAPTSIIADLSDVPTSLVTFSMALLEKHSTTVDEFRKMSPASKPKLLEGEKVATFGPGGLVDKMITDMLTMNGASRWQLWSTLKLPALFPYWITGARIAVPMGLVGAIIGEFISGDRGIGFRILQASNFFETSEVFAGLFVLSVMVLLLNAVLGSVERHFIQWRLPAA